MESVSAEFAGGIGRSTAFRGMVSLIYEGGLEDQEKSERWQSDRLPHTRAG